MEKLNKKMSYNEGIFNSKNERLMAKALNLIFDKMDEMIDEINSLKKSIKEIQEIENTTSHGK